MTWAFWDFQDGGEDRRGRWVAAGLSVELYCFLNVSSEELVLKEQKEMLSGKKNARGWSRGNSKKESWYCRLDNNYFLICVLKLAVIERSLISKSIVSKGPFILEFQVQLWAPGNQDFCLIWSCFASPPSEASKLQCKVVIFHWDASFPAVHFRLPSDSFPAHWVLMEVKDPRDLLHIMANTVSGCLLLDRPPAEGRPADRHGENTGSEQSFSGPCHQDCCLS